MYITGRLGLVIDGTGKDFQKIVKQRKVLQDLGYDTAMIFVNTDLDTAIERDKNRDRSLGEKEVTKYWKSVQKNIGAFQTMFGKQKMLVVDNSTGKDFKKETLRAYRDIKKFVDREPDNPLAKKWIKQERAKKKRT
jgi:deoxyadenosine/deoxycytidine kinase